MDNKKTRILVIADNPLAPSGVATQTKYMIEGMLRTGDFSFVCLAGALKHSDYRPIKIEPHNDDWIIIPVDGYSNEEEVRAMIHNYKPDILWFMTDPRFWPWLWEIENEIRPYTPMVYYHVWDNYPYPKFNADFYNSNDVVCSISKVTDDIIRTVAPNVKCVHIPHTVDTQIFKKRDESEWVELRKQAGTEGKFVLFWNNRNARRKQSGTLLWWFKEFLDIVGHDRATLIMHTEPNDPNGQDLYAIIKELDLSPSQVLLSTRKVDPVTLSKFYNAADCTVNIADAEGFGLGTLESLACETPIITTMTGGLQEQVTDGKDWFGIGIEPSSKVVIGSQDVPYIYEDRISKEDFLSALKKMYEMSESERNTLGLKGRKHVLKNYSMAQYTGLWYETFTNIVENMSSWKDRKNYKSYTLESL